MAKFTVGFDTPFCLTTTHGHNRASHLSWRVVILMDGREYLPTGDYIRQLHEDNSFKQSEWLREQGKSWASPPDYIDPSIKPRDFPIPEKTAFILAALNAVGDDAAVEQAA